MARGGCCVWPSPEQRDMDASSSSMFRIFDTAASGMLAQSVRLNTTASNMANADSVASSPDQVYRARQPVFAAIQRSEEHTSELQSLMRISYAVFCLKKKITHILLAYNRPRIHVATA